MGTDIHGVLQERWGSGSHWFDMGEIPDTRHYFLFSILAGIRNSEAVIPISEPRGFPEGFKVDGDENHGFHWMGDHDYSWLTLKEIRDWDGWDEESRERCATFLAWLTYAELLTEGYEARIVFGFDS